MSVTIGIPYLTVLQQHWLEQNVGPRLYYLHHSVGGKGWKAQRVDGYYLKGKPSDKCWRLTFEDDKMATLFALKWA